MMTNNEIIAVVEAKKRGEVIERTPLDGTDDDWYVFPPAECWNFIEYKYRVKPVEPAKPQEVKYGVRGNHLGRYVFDRACGEHYVSQAVNLVGFRRYVWDDGHCSDIPFEMSRGMCNWVVFEKRG